MQRKEQAKVAVPPMQRSFRGQQVDRWVVWALVLLILVFSLLDLYLTVSTLT